MIVCYNNYGSNWNTYDDCCTEFSYHDNDNQQDENNGDCKDAKNKRYFTKQQRGRAWGAPRAMETSGEETVLDLPVYVGTLACKLSFTDTAGESEMHFLLNIYLFCLFLLPGCLSYPFATRQRTVRS